MGLQRMYRFLRKPICMSLLVLSTRLSGSDASGIIKIAGGEQGGNYYKMACAISNLAKKHGAQVQVVASQGSIENIGLIKSGAVDFALVQADVARRAVRGHQPFTDPALDLVLVSPVFTEAVQVLIRSDLYVFNTAELKGKIVCLGPEQSGTDVTSRAVLEASGIALEEVQPKHFLSAAVGEQLRNETVDAAFFVSSIPNAVISRALSAGDARLLLLDSKVIGRLVGTGSYVETEISKHTYPLQDDALTTIGTQALLITRKAASFEDVALILRILESDRNELTETSGLKLNLLDTVDVSSAPLPLHGACLQHLRRGGRFSWLLLAGLGCAAALLAILAFKRTHIRRSITGHVELLLGVTVLLAVWLGAATALYLNERYVNENFSTFGKSLWSVLVYVSGGFQTRAPMTRNGEIAAVIAITVGVSVVAWFVAQLATHFVGTKIKVLENLIRGRSIVPATLKDHIVLINWDHRTEEIIEQLHGPDLPVKIPVIIVCQNAIRLPDRPAFEHCIAICGEPTDRRVLEQARVPHAHSVTVVSAWRTSDAADGRRILEPDMADAKTILVLLAIRNLCLETRTVPVTAEVRSARNVEAAKNAAGNGPTEIVCAEIFGTNILTQCALTPGLAEIYNDLLTFAPGTDEIYKIPVPERFVGAPFSALLHHFADHYGVKEKCVIPIAIYRNGQVRLNPGDEIGKMSKDDWLFVIAENTDAWKRPALAVSTVRQSA